MPSVLEFYSEKAELLWRCCPEKPVQQVLAWIQLASGGAGRQQNLSKDALDNCGYQFPTKLLWVIGAHNWLRWVCMSLSLYVGIAGIPRTASTFKTTKREMGCWTGYHACRALGQPSGSKSALNSSCGWHIAPQIKQFRYDYPLVIFYIANYWKWSYK